MALIRGHHSFDNHFTQIPNDWVRDTRLTFKARGLLVLLLSHQQGWSLSIETISRQQNIGKDALRSAVQELERFGYLTRSQQQNGKFGEAVWTTSDPAENPMAENPTTENPTHKNNKLKNNNLKNDFAQVFEQFWKSYPRKVGKIAAMRAFLKAVENTPPEWIIEGASKFATDPNLPETQFIPHPTTWLNRGSWADGPLPERIKTPQQIQAEAEEQARLRAEERARRIAEETEAARKLEAELREKSAPAPRCKHGENLALCKLCL